MGYNLLGGPILSYLPWRVGCIFIQYVCVYLISIWIDTNVCANRTAFSQVLTSTYQQLGAARLAGLDGPCDVKALELERRAKGPSPFRILKTSSWVTLPKTVIQEKSQLLRLVGVTNAAGDFWWHPFHPSISLICTKNTGGCSCNTKTFS